MTGKSCRREWRKFEFSGQSYVKQIPKRWSQSNTYLSVLYPCTNQKQLPPTLGSFFPIPEPSWETYRGHWAGGPGKSIIVLTCLLTQDLTRLHFVAHAFRGVHGAVSRASISQCLRDSMYFHTSVPRSVVHFHAPKWEGFVVWQPIFTINFTLPHTVRYVTGCEFV